MEKVKIIFNDGTWLIGERRWWFAFQEPWNSNHFIVLDGSNEELKNLIHLRVSIPKSSIKYLTFLSY